MFPQLRKNIDIISLVWSYIFFYCFQGSVTTADSNVNMKQVTCQYKTASSSVYSDVYILFPILTILPLVLFVNTVADVFWKTVVSFFSDHLELHSFGFLSDVSWTHILFCRLLQILLQADCFAIFLSARRHNIAILTV